MGRAQRGAARGRDAWVSGRRLLLATTVAAIGLCIHPAVATGTLPATGNAPPAPKHTAERPNILFILIDDMGFGDLSATGNRLVATPNIDRLASEGLMMTQFYDAAPICSPSRAGFMTGQFPARNRFVTYIAHRQRNERFGQANWLDPKLPNLARTLKQAGYATGHFGKWHLGGTRDVGEAPLPTEYGFDASYTQFEGLGPRVLPSDLGGNLSQQSAALGKGPIDWLPRAEVTGRYVDKTLEFVRKQGKQPWFAQLWLDDMHNPWKPSDAQLAAVAGKGRNPEETRFLAVLTAMDAEIGRLIEGLRAAGQLDNTVIVFTSDNGPTVGADSPGSAGPYRGRKGSLYEGGVRQPLIVRWKGQVPAGRRDADSVMQGVDLYPTLARIAGAPAPAGLDGIDVGAAWRGRTITSRPDIYSHIARPRAESRFGPLYSIRSGPWKFLANADGSGAELYNISADPGEQRDRAASDPAVARRLAAKLAAWVASLPAPGPGVGQ